MKEKPESKEKLYRPEDIKVGLEVKSVKDLMREVRSVKEICLKFPEIEHKPKHEIGELQIIICLASFSYPT